MNKVSGAALANSYKSVYKRLFTAAYAITGSERAAQDVLIEALINVGPRKRKRALEEVKQLALIQGTAEPELLPDEEELQQRVQLMYYGCHLKPSEIAHLTGKKRSELKQLLNGGTPMVALPGSREAPDLATLKRALDYRIEQRALEGSHGHTRHSLLYLLCEAVLLLIIAGLLWLGAILINYYIQAAGGINA